jgi:hypothetical protein
MTDPSHRWAARSFARLLVGDIRLYNEEDVILGRRHGDLVQRLDHPLQQARQRYLARFAQVDPLASFLRTEMLEMLAAGRHDLLP